MNDFQELFISETTSAGQSCIINPDSDGILNLTLEVDTVLTSFDDQDGQTITWAHVACPGWKNPTPSIENLMPGLTFQQFPELGIRCRGSEFSTNDLPPLHKLHELVCRDCIVPCMGGERRTAGFTGANCIGNDDVLEDLLYLEDICDNNASDYCTAISEMVNAVMVERLAGGTLGSFDSSYCSNYDALLSNTTKKVEVPYSFICDDDIQTVEFPLDWNDANQDNQIETVMADIMFGHCRL